MKKIMAWIILGGVAIMVPLLAKKLGNLPEVSNFASIHVYNNRLYVLDHKVHIDLYSLKPFRYIKQVSRYGVGPGECPTVPRITFYPDHFYLYRNGKCMFFSHNGEYIKEFRIPNPNLNLFAPLGENFITEQSSYNKTFTNFDLSICTYKEKEKIKHKKVVSIFNLPNKREENKKYGYRPFAEGFDYYIFEDKIFIADSTRGIFAEIYDSEGNRISQIRLAYEKRKVPEENKKRLRDLIESNQNWKAYDNIYFLDIPEYYPAYHKFFIGKGKLYFLMYVMEDSNREIIVTDWKGKLLKRSYVKTLIPTEGILCEIENDKFYYIFDNEESEEWELHVEDIK